MFSRQKDVGASSFYFAKGVNIVSVKLVKESSLLYKERSVRSPEDGYQLMKFFLADNYRFYGIRYGVAVESN